MYYLHVGPCDSGTVFIGTHKFGPEPNHKLYGKGCIEMKMKKIVSGLVAAVLALSLSAPAFAATPGEEAQSLSTDIQQSLYKDDVDAATAQMEQMTATLQDNSVTVSSAMNISALAYFDTLESAGTLERVRFETEDGRWYQVRYPENGTFTSGPDFVTYSGDTITVDTVIHGESSATGYSISVEVPMESEATYYTIKMLGDNAQLNDSLIPVQYLYGEDGSLVRKFVSFWVPHFTAYQLTPVAIQPEQPAEEPEQTQQGGSEHPEIGEAIANGTWGKEEGSASTTNSSTASTTATGAENPIKKTGLEMDFTFLAVVALTAAAVCGMGYAAKKSRKGE